MNPPLTRRRFRQTTGCSVAGLSLKGRGWSRVDPLSPHRERVRVRGKVGSGTAVHGKAGEAHVTDKLQHLRGKIDEIDTKLVRLLNDRTRRALEIGKVKRASGGEIYAPDREEAVLRRLVETNPGPLTEESLRAIYREIMSSARALEKALVIAYLGPEATYSHMAAVHKFGSSLDYEPLPSISD